MEVPFTAEFIAVPANTVSLPGKFIENGSKVIFPSAAKHLIIGGLNEIKLTAGNKTTHGKVLEFTAPDDKIYIPSWMMQSLNINEGGRIRVDTVKLPEASYVKLQMISGSTNEIDSFILFLRLKDVYPCLTTGDIITIGIKGKKHELLVKYLSSTAVKLGFYDENLIVDLEGPTGCLDVKRIIEEGDIVY